MNGRACNRRWISFFGDWFILKLSPSNYYQIFYFGHLCKCHSLPKSNQVIINNHHKGMFNLNTSNYNIRIRIVTAFSFYKQKELNKRHYLYLFLQPWQCSRKNCTLNCVKNKGTQNQIVQFFYIDACITIWNIKTEKEKKLKEFNCQSHLEARRHTDKRSRKYIW